MYKIKALDGSYESPVYDTMRGARQALQHLRRNWANTYIDTRLGHCDPRTHLAHFNTLMGLETLEGWARDKYEVVFEREQYRLELEPVLLGGGYRGGACAD